MSPRFWLALLAATVFCLPARAAEFTVDTFFDLVDASPGDGTCAGMFDLCGLRTAIMEANATAGEDTIHLPAGTYILLAPSTADEDACADGDLDVTDDLILLGDGSATTVIDGNGGTVLERVFHVLPPAASFKMTGVDVRNGDATASSSSNQDGGGIFIDGAIAGVLTDVAVRYNVAENVGGVGSHGALTLADCFIEDNEATLAVGGAANLGGEPLTLTNTVVEGNVSGGGSFGAAVTSDGDLSVTGGSVSHNLNISPGSTGAGLLSIGSSKTVTLKGVAISGNEGELGAGVASTNDTTIDDCVIEGNRAKTGDGGGILMNTGTALTVTNSTIAHNDSASGGGGVRMNGALSMTDTTLQGNSTFKAGGGVVNESATEASVFTRVKVLSNSVKEAGGVGFGGGIATVSHTTIEDSEISGNSSEINGGGLFVATDVTIRRTAIHDNQAVGSGAGAWLGGGGTVAVEDSTFSGNRAFAADGGGLAIVSGTAVSVTNVTLSGNAAGSHGGGMAVAATATLVNTTFFGNESATGANYYNDGGAPTFTNTILAAPVTGANCGGAAVASGGFNLEDANSCAFAGTGDQHDTDPQLGPLADNGGPTLTHKPLAGSPAIDAGTDAGAPAKDQRGFTRPLDGDGDGTAAFDSGAVEFDHCGDGDLIDPEACDDGNAESGDGCSDACAVEDGFTCEGSPSVCTKGGATGGTAGTGGGTAGTGTGEPGGGGCSLIR